MSKPCPNCSHPIDVGLFYGGGRPSKLTPKLLDSICEAIEDGAPIQVAAASEGVFKQRLHEWKRRGAEERKADPNSDSPYAAFADSVERARARFETRTLRRLQTLDASEVIEIEGVAVKVNKIDPKVASSLTKSLTWLLERLRNERYGTLVTIKVSEAKQELFESLARVLQRRGIDMSIMREVLAELSGTPLEAKGDALN